MSIIHIPERYLEIVQGILSKYPYSFYAFGSRVKGTPRTLSDHDIDLADISLVILAAEMKCGTILSFDKKDFAFLKWEGSRPFDNLGTL